MDTKERKIKYTQARDSVLHSFQELGDYNIQLQQWVKPESKHAFWDNIWYCCLDTLLDGYSLDNKAYSQIGDTIYDEEEAEAIQEYCAWVLELINYEIGPDLPDEAYYNHPKWKEVVEGALKIRKLMARKNKENNFWREFDEDEGEYVPNDQEHRLKQEDEKYLD